MIGKFLKQNLMDLKMINQHTNNWEQRFINKDTPWEEQEPSLYLNKILNYYAKEGSSILEVGCGLGLNAKWLASLGYKVKAIDISKTAIEKAKKHSNLISNLSFEYADFLKSKITQKFDILFDKGCLHTFNNIDSYLQFAQQVANQLKPGGLWVNISGNADQPENLDLRKQEKYPRISLKDIAILIEPNFEALEIKRGIFGTKNNFLSWIGVYKKKNSI